MTGIRPPSLWINLSLQFLQVILISWMLKIPQQWCFHSGVRKCISQWQRFTPCFIKCVLVCAYQDETSQHDLGVTWRNLQFSWPFVPIWHRCPGSKCSVVETSLLNSCCFLAGFGSAELGLTVWLYLSSSCQGDDVCCIMIEVMKIEKIASSAVAEWFLSTSRQDSCYFWSEIYCTFFATCWNQFWSKSLRYSMTFMCYFMMSRSLGCLENNISHLKEN